ncbi:cytochrome ubiquinol oxidase subunit I [Streptomyces fractus]|uniref:cytochrome ubiquinol oxidase subunit I n=1 Tax=Streptomyces fractus TaxID=641806 RepID=UPI003CEC639F
MDLALAPDTIARWQFGITTVYHFLFVPLTISLSALTAGLHTAWVRTGKEKYFHATKFWGKLFLINIALGVATGLVQEFQFGMNWSDYSQFVGDVFGAPLAMEALIAFFFESTFIGLWIFGWGRLPKKLHCACIWMVALGTVLSAYFILAANTWMQHPVGYAINADGSAQLTNIWSVLFQKATVVIFAHTITSAFLTGAAFIVGVASYHLWRAKKNPEKAAADGGKTVAAMRTSLRMGLIVAIISGLGVTLSGDQVAKEMFKEQPMKMAAAEALWDGQNGAPFSIFAVGDVDEGHNSVELSIPDMLSFLADSNFDSYVPGINDTAQAEADKYGGQPSDYMPSVFVTFWGFRVMIGFGMVSFVGGIVGLWLTRQKKFLAHQFRTGEYEVPRLMLTKQRELGPTLTKWAWRFGLLTMTFPLIANSAGWIFTEMGRQPWVVNGLMTTADAVSPNISPTEQLIGLSVLTVLYAVLAVIEVRLTARHIKKGPDTSEEPPSQDPTLRGPSALDEDADAELTFAY